LQAGGHRFDPVHLHHLGTDIGNSDIGTEGGAVCGRPERLEPDGTDRWKLGEKNPYSLAPGVARWRVLLTEDCEEASCDVTEAGTSG
jgi:hypothetical protein